MSSAIGRFGDRQYRLRVRQCIRACPLAEENFDHGVMMCYSLCGDGASLFGWGEICTPRLTGTPPLLTLFCMVSRRSFSSFAFYIFEFYTHLLLYLLHAAYSKFNICYHYLCCIKMIATEVAQTDSKETKSSKKDYLLRLPRPNRVSTTR